MKISFVIILAVLFCSFTEKAVSQNARVSINARNVSVSELLTRIESQTDYLFVYSKNNVDVNRRVTIRTKEEPVARVLNEVFRDTDVRYAMEGTHIVLVPKSRVGEKDDLPAIERVQQIFVSGTVVDMAGDPLPGVNVTIKGTTTGTVTGIDGQYRISIPDRDVTLSYSFV
ncbi:MAG: STN domain-containing protein, partial [Bacteroidales bacterium]|nr:STN domain-containing protein [Bacteroidales bacterium]